MYFLQIPVGPMGNLSYLLGCEETRIAAVADPSFEPEKLLRRAAEEGYGIAYLFTTHGHADHTNGHAAVIRETGARVVAHPLEEQRLREQGLPLDLPVRDDAVIRVGNLEVRVLHTPGHTPGGICLLVEGRKLLTGDTLFVGDCGRTDLPGGSSADLFASIRRKLRPLPQEIEVHPGHDYGETPSSTIGREQRSNPAMRCTTLEEFEALP